MQQIESIDGSQIASVPIKSCPGQSLVVDAEDLDLVGEYNWRLSGWGYVEKSHEKKSVFLHRLIYEKHFGTISDGKMIDHIDQNPLNNRKSNLRLCSNTQNQRNKKVRKNNKLGVKGVHIDQGSYRATINLNQKSIHLGRFKTLEDAALAYNIASILIHQDFASLNQYRVDIFDEIQKKRFFELKEQVKARLSKNDQIVFAELSDNIILERLSSSEEEEEED